MIHDPVLASLIAILIGTIGCVLVVLFSTILGELHEAKKKRLTNSVPTTIQERY